MFSLGVPVFAWAPGRSKQRVLNPGKVVEIAEGGQVVTAKFEDELNLDPEESVQLFVEFRGKFFQQGATTIGKPNTECPPDACASRETQPNTFDFRRVGEPVSAESRCSYRVSVVSAGIEAVIGPKKSRCPVVDVSPEGFAVILPAAPTIGTNLPVNWSVDGTTVDGTARVQTIKQLKNGTFRVGLLMPEKKSPARRALEKLSITLQRMQLKRLAGAA
jgi:hypothetical protein